VAKRLRGQPIKIPLGTAVGLEPAHIVLHGHSAPPKWGQHAPLFSPCLLWPNGWMDQDATWYGGIPLGMRRSHWPRPMRPSNLITGSVFSDYVLCTRGVHGNGNSHGIPMGFPWDSHWIPMGMGVVLGC